MQLSPMEEKIIGLYHRTMDERLTDGKVSGDSRAGALTPVQDYALARSGARALSYAAKPVACRVSVVGTPWLSQPRFL